MVLASFANRYSAERMLGSLGRGFRTAARKSDAVAFIVSGNRDGSLKLTQSRLVSASGLAVGVIGVSVATVAGLMGMMSILKGARSQTRAAHLRQSHVGASADRAHEILAQAGRHAALALVRCNDPELCKAVAARAADRGHESWDGSLEEFLASLDPSGEYDWVRTALGESVSR